LSAGELAKITISSGIRPDGRTGCIVDIDDFGNIRTSVPNHIPDSVLGSLAGFSIKGGGLDVAGKAKIVRTFSEVEAQEPAFVLSSTGFLDLVVNRGNASREFDIHPSSLGLDVGLWPRTTIDLSFSADRVPYNRATT
jgi:S-adenosylmethionine hydrolase